MPGETVVCHSNTKSKEDDVFRYAGARGRRRCRRRSLLASGQVQAFQQMTPPLANLGKCSGTARGSDYKSEARFPFARLSVRQNRLDAASENPEHVPTSEAPTGMPSLHSNSRLLVLLLALGRAAQAADGEGSVKVVPAFSVAGKSGTWTV